jgi:hypothetical protein
LHLFALANLRYIFVLAGGRVMIQSIDVVFLHSPDKDLADWYAEVLGLEKGVSDGSWTEYRT